jgi:tellurite resistance protein
MIEPVQAAAAPRTPSVRNLPVNLFGAVMSLAGLALAWRLAHVHLGVPAVIGESIAAFAALAFVVVAGGYGVKLARHPDAVQAEFRHPVAGNFFGTFVIAVLLMASVVEPYSATAAQLLWSAGGVATFAICFVVVSRLLKGRVDAAHATPAWLVPCVATLDIAVTGGHMPMRWAPEFSLVAGSVGAVLALVLLSLIVSRLVHHHPLAPAMTPSLMILVAPFAVGFLAYGNIIGGVDRFGALLFWFALFMFAVVAPRIFRRGATFTPSWWAIGFPMAALANAALRYAAVRDSVPLWWLAAALLGALTLALAVLTLHTLRFAMDRRLFM